MCCKRGSGRYEPTDAEHIANVLTHATMIPVGLIAALILMWRSTTVGMFSVSVVYGGGMVILFSVSTIFHITVYRNSGSEFMWQKSDRAVIYLFIAACYSPWLFLLNLPDDKLFVHFKWIIWVLAFLGVSFELTISWKHPIKGIAFYVLYGVVPGIILNSQMNFPGVPELKLSGGLYLIGVIFFRSDGIVPFAHAIWHVFVIMGASVHYLSVYKYFY